MGNILSPTFGVHVEIMYGESETGASGATSRINSNKKLSYIS
jgi:hypothetical protein